MVENSGGDSIELPVAALYDPALGAVFVYGDIAGRGEILKCWSSTLFGALLDGATEASFFAI